MRVKDFSKLPSWLQGRLIADWENIIPDPALRALPNLRDPEYRVYPLGDGGWWAVDAGTGGITVEREGEAHAYGDLPEGSELQQLVDRYAKLALIEENIDGLCDVACSLKVGPEVIRRIITDINRDTPGDGMRIIQALVSMLYDGLTYGNWPK